MNLLTEANALHTFVFSFSIKNVFVEIKKQVFYNFVRNLILENKKTRFQLFNYWNWLENNYWKWTEINA